MVIPQRVNPLDFFGYSYVLKRHNHPQPPEIPERFRLNESVKNKIMVKGQFINTSPYSGNSQTKIKLSSKEIQRYG